MGHLTVETATVYVAISRPDKSSRVVSFAVSNAHVTVCFCGKTNCVRSRDGKAVDEGERGESTGHDEKATG